MSGKGYGLWDSVQAPLTLITAFRRLARSSTFGRSAQGCGAAGGVRGSPFLVTYLHIALAQLHLAEDNLTEALTTARRALELADRSGFQLERGAARRVLAQVYGAIGSRAEAESEFRASLEILEDIQSRPELGQTLLAYGRFGISDDAERGRRVIDRALRLFEEIDATGWIAEAKAALGER